MTNNHLDQSESHFFRGLPLKEELASMQDDIINRFYDPETSCLDYTACQQAKAYIGTKKISMAKKIA